MPISIVPAPWLEKGEFGRSLADSAEAIRLDPNDPRSYYSRGIGRLHIGDYDRAIVDLDQAIRLNPRFAAAYDQRGCALGRKGMF